MMHISSLLFLVTLVAAFPQRRDSLDPLLTSIGKVSDLSTFYSLFEGTGGDSGKSGPDFEERFNDPNNNLQFTALAPTNEALARLPTGLISALQQPQSYEILKSFLINHIAPSNLSDAELHGGDTVEAVGGFTVTFDQDGKITTNSDLHKGTAPQASLVQTSASEFDCIPASNGRVCKIDGVLDGFLTYFGEDVGGESSELPPVQEEEGSIEDIIANSNSLSTLHSVLKQIDSDFLGRLSGDTNAQQSTVYLAPGNAAFDALPGEGLSKLFQPSNDGLSSFLLEFGFGKMDDGSQVLVSDKGFNIPIRGTQVLNAQVTNRICAKSGKECIWVIGRLLDPLCAQGTS